MHLAGLADRPAGVLDAAVEVAIASPDDEAVRGAVRDLLRHGKYKPTGRGKPASEYLRQAAREGRFPRIDALVDLNNLASLESGLPISVLDLTRAGRQFILRYGRAGESYVFNAAGHTIDLQDLLLIARLPEDQPCANAVKDSMATKVGSGTTEALAVIYAPAARAARAERAAERFATLACEALGARARAWLVS
ncbi:MAG: hypothetical protein IT378_20330 [Sandaracinaceae bacterium]|nr:hypothetical protein [Sandaracinaceae bacterium]